MTDNLMNFNILVSNEKSGWLDKFLKSKRIMKEKTCEEILRSHKDFEEKLIRKRLEGNLLMNIDIMKPNEIIIKKIEDSLANEINITWQDFYEWLEAKGYHVYRESNIFRYSKFITDFDPIEDSDSGEIEETIALIKEKDTFNFN